MKSKIRKLVPLILIMLMALIVIPQTFATDQIIADDNTNIDDNVETTIINETNTDNTELSKNLHNTNYNILKSSQNKAPDGNYWIMSMNPTEITYDSNGCSVDVTIEKNGISAAGDLYYWINGVKTSYTVYQGDSYTKATTATESFKIILSSGTISSAFTEDGVYEVSLRPSDGESYFGFTMNSITPEFGSVKVTVGSGGSTSTKTTTTTLTIDNEGTTVAKGTPITGSLMAGTTPVSGATIKFTSTYGSSGTSVTTDENGKFSISTSSAIQGVESYSGFKFEGNDNYEASSSDKSFSIVATPKIVTIVVNPTSTTYTAGSKSEVSVTLTISGGSFYSDDVIVWVDDDSDKVVKVRSLEYGSATFTIDLDDLKDSEKNVDLSSTLAFGDHTLHFSISSESYWTSTSWTINKAELSVTGVSGGSTDVTDYITTATVSNSNSVSYNKGESTIVNVKVQYPSTATDLVSTTMWVYIYSSDESSPAFAGSSSGGINTGLKSDKDFTFDLNTISDNLDDGKSYKIYFGPNSGSLAYLNEIYGNAVYNPLTVTVSSPSSEVTKYTTTPTVSGSDSVSYTKGTSTVVDVAVDYPSDTDFDYISTVYVNIDTISSSTRVAISGVSPSSKSFTFDLETIKDKLSVGTHTLYFGPNPGALYDNVEYNPLTVTVSDSASSSKTSTTLTIDNTATSLITGTPITGKLVDEDNNPISGATITYDLDGTSKSVTTESDGTFSISTSTTGTYSKFSYAGDTTYESSSSSKSFTVADQKQFTLTVTEDSIEYTPGTSTIIHGTMSFPTSIWFSSSNNGNRLFVWFDDDISTQILTSDDYGYYVSLGNGDFEVHLSKLEYEFKSGKNYKLTFGPKDGESNGDLAYYNAKIVLDSVTVTIPGIIKTDTEIVLDDNVIVEGSTISGKLLDENGNALVGKTINVGLKLPSGLTEDVNDITTGSDGSFTLANTKVGVYTFTFPEDSTYAKATAKVTVTYENKKVTVSITEDAITIKDGVSTIINGKISDPGYVFYYASDNYLYVWIDGDLSTQQIACDDYGSYLRMTSSSFEVDLSKITGLEAGNTYTLTFGPKDGKYNSILTDGYYLYSADLDTITVKVTDKSLTTIKLDNTNLKATQDITGTLLDENNDPIANKDVSYLFNGESKTVQTDSNGVFTISNAVEGTYSDFKFVGDNTYEESTPVSNVIVTGPETTVLTVNKIDDTVFVGKTITGTLVDGEGNPIADATIKYTSPSGADTVTTDESGVFTISNVVLGEYKDFSYDANINYKASSVNGVVTVINTPTYDGVIYVSKSGKDSNDGSESSSVLTIAKAIELAEYTTDHKIIISAGTYKEHDLSISSPLTILGIGNVIIDANKEGRIFDISGNNEVNLANLTLINGQADYGGAIKITDAKVSIDTLTFRNNNATEYGGAISWAANDGIVKNSIFNSNSARTSGAINWGNGYSPAKTTGGKIINCTFDSNSAWWKTAAVGLYDSCEVINSTFKNNKASNPSGTAIEVGALYIYASDCLVTGSEFINNYASGYGGAILIDSNSDGTVINNSTFISNTGNVGGAIEAQGSNIIIANSTFSKNHATSSGGAIDVLLNDDSDEGVFIYNNVFESNLADGNGGAISFDSSELSGWYGSPEGVFVENNKFISNDAPIGGALSDDISGYSPSEIEIKNNQFINNTASEYGGAIFDGKLTLESNIMSDNDAPVGANIYLESGSIVSDFTLTFTDITALVDDTIVLTAILTDDNDNSIVIAGFGAYWPGIDFTVDGNAVSGTVVRNPNNMTIEYSVTEAQGTYAISGSLDSDYGSPTVVDGTLEVVNQLETVLTVESRTIDYGGSFTGSLTDVNGKALSGMEILYKYNGNVLKTTTNADGVFTISSTLTGIYSDFSFAGSDSYLESSSDATVTVRAQVIPEPVVSIVNVTIVESRVNATDGSVIIHLSSADGSVVNIGNVNLTVANITRVVPVVGGVATFYNINLSSGSYSAQVSYLAGGDYNNASKVISIFVDNATDITNTTNTTVDNTTNITNNTNVSVSNLSTRLSLEFEELSEGHRLYGVLVDENNNPLSDSVDIILSRLSNGQSKTYTVSSVNGEFNLPVNLATGDYRAYARYKGKDIYLPTTSSNILISLTDTPSNVVLNDSDEVTGVYGDENKYEGVLTDKEGNALAGYHVAVNITRLSSGASKVYYVTTDFEGNYIMPINLAPGVYVIRTSVDDNNFTGSALTSLVISSNDTVSNDTREISVLRANKYESTYQSGESFTGSIFTSLGYGIPGQHISITLSNSRGQSKTYNVVSDYNGDFSLPINLGRGTYTALCSFAGTDIYRPVESNTVSISIL